MSQQAAAGRGAGRGGGRRHRYGPRGGGTPAPKPTKSYESPIAEIKQHTFNTGDNGHAAQFTESREKIATYIQRCGWEESYLVAETIRTGVAQKVALPPPVDVNDPDRVDLEAMRIEDVKNVAKRRQKLSAALMKGYATVYDQCSQQVQDKRRRTGRRSKRSSRSMS